MKGFHAMVALSVRSTYGASSPRKAIYLCLINSPSCVCHRIFIKRERLPCWKSPTPSFRLTLIRGYGSKSLVSVSVIEHHGGRRSALYRRAVTTLRLCYLFPRVQACPFPVFFVSFVCLFVRSKLASPV